MTGGESARLAQSIRARLLTLAKDRNETFDLVLTRYALERFLFRLSKSSCREEFVLKGAMLFQIWGSSRHRATRDIDFLVLGEGDRNWIERRIRAISATPVDGDGLDFDASGLSLREIREESRYGGIRAKLIAHLGTARIPVQIDFGFGDVITPAPLDISYPTLLPMEAPRVMTYPRETVVAEKLEAIVDLGIDNSRMKDFFDLWFIATTYNHDEATLKEAVRRTFERRRQSMPTDLPVGLSDDFVNNKSKQAQWQAFRERVSENDLQLSEVIGVVREFASAILWKR